MLKLIQVDPSIMDLNSRIPADHILGIDVYILYNFFSSTLRALGDSNSPLYFLIISAVLNVFGDLFFVIVLKDGSRGCAISTVLSEALCSLFCVIYIQKKCLFCVLEKNGWYLTACLLKEDHCLWLGICHAAGNCAAWKDRYPGDRKYHGRICFSRICGCQPY